MAPLACDPTALDRAGATILDAGVSLGTVISALTAALGGSAGMAGDDPVGAAFGRAYDGAATKLIEAMADTRNGLVSIGDGIRVSAHNYALAEAMSDVTGRAAGLPAPPVTGPFTAGSAPSAVGAGHGAPAGWGWVEPYIGMIWPSGDSAKLRAAATAWTTAGVNFMAAETAAGGGTMAAIAGQQIPEGAAINKALSDASNATTDLARQCQTIAAQLNSYAAHVDQVHAAILDLLSRICDPLTGIKEVWDLLTDEDEDEIARIANDIKTVVNSFGHEAQILGTQINATMSAAATAAKDMGHWAAKEWNHVLHDAKAALNQVGRVIGGVGEEGWGFLKSAYEISQIRAAFDPIGYGKDVGGMVLGAAPLVGAGGEHAPSFGDSWKELGKSLSHWDEWSQDPAKALGKSLFDLATLPIPGGPLSKLGKVGRAAADALKDFKKPPEIPTPPSVKPPAEPTPTGPKPTEPHQPAPSGKPVPGPADGPPPRSPTESKPPPTEKPPTAGEPPKPTGAPPVAGDKPAVPTQAGDAPLPHPKPPEPVPAPAPTTPGRHSVEPASPATPPESTPHIPTPTAPHAPTPPEGAPQGGEPGVHLPEPHQPHGGSPHPPGESTPPHQPREGHEPPGSHPPDPSPPPDHPEDGHPPGVPLLSDLEAWRQAQLTLAASPGQLARDFVEHGCPPDIAESALHSPYSGMTAQDVLNQFWDPAKGTWKWPEANGFADGKWETANSIPEEVRLDRIGEVNKSRGDFMGTVGDSYPQRGLAPGSSGDYNIFQGTGKPLPLGWEVRHGKVAEAFGQPGGGTQWVVVDDKGNNVLIDTLIDRGYLRRP